MIGPSVALSIGRDAGKLTQEQMDWVITDLRNSLEIMRTPDIYRSDAVTMKSTNQPLSSVARGKRFVVLDIPQGKPRTQLIRLGIMKGEVIKCVERLPGGTVVVEKNRQEIAIGATLAEFIRVDYVVSG
jgi:Fe2+ transport system protein FeoA